MPENPVGVNHHGQMKGQAGNPNWGSRAKGTGISGNPAGRPLLADRIARFLDEVDLVSGMSNEDRIVKAHIERAKKGDINSTIWLMDHVYGKVADKVQQEHTVSMVPWDEKNEAEQITDNFDLREAIGLPPPAPAPTTDDEQP